MGGSTGPHRAGPWRPVAAVVVTALSLVLAGFCVFMASLMTYGLYTWSEPQLDPAVAVPLLGIGLSLALGPLVMSLGERRRFWLRVALAVSISSVLIASLATWVPVAAGWR